ncbi:DJ-1/PfpI family protein [Zobellia galactanivorans]|uniref:Family C56 non-peptidase protein n=1 Tax=Zobellia galactanivorans (strain DSM 12802 / CCUG 47099 / CIP 106680 / NCIMB 13871 / Dsij) TaxID=63186 RepID=G0LCJ1_ZOBGA|nr:DJ-1/PfpI family protein [Zobellia galactanivorans]CAZ96957.1 Family C56 non-peptidase protein [Zobellia galactanivorans]
MKPLYPILLALIVFCSCTSPKEKAGPKADSKRISPEILPHRYNVAFLIMDGTFNTELTAPLDIFQHTKFRKNIKAMNTFTIANTLNPITTFEGIRLLPDFDYTKDELPPIDILVIPSAEHHLDMDLKDTVMLDFVQKTDRSALFMTSHCDGAFVLAKAGVLKGKTSTTFPSDIKAYKKMFPDLKVADSVLFVHDGKYITSAGGAKSFEAALYLCQYLYGKEVADALAKGLVIDWNLEKTPHLIID